MPKKATAEKAENVKEVKTAKKTSTKKSSTKTSSKKDVAKKTTAKAAVVEAPVLEETKVAETPVSEKTVIAEPAPAVEKKVDILKIVLAVAVVVLSLILIGNGCGTTKVEETPATKDVVVAYNDESNITLNVPSDWFYSKDVGGFMQVVEGDQLDLKAYCYYTVSVTQTDWENIVADVTENYDTMDVSSTGKDNVIVIVSNEEGITPYKDVLAYDAEIETFYEIVMIGTEDADVLNLINHLN